MTSFFLEACARLVAALYLAGGLAVVSYWLARRLVPDAPPLLRWCAWMTSGMALATAGFHLLIPFRLFRLPLALAAMALLLAATLAPAANREELAATLAVDRRWLRRLAARARVSPRRGWLLAFAVCAAPIVLRPLVTPPLSWDTFVYHGVKPAFWVQEGGPALVLDPIGSWDFMRSTYAGGEVFAAWAMLPLRSDLLVGASQVVQWLGLLLATIALAREMGLREPYATATAGLVASLGTIRLQVGSGYVEVALALALAMAFAFALRWLRRRSAACAVLACVALGLAVGIKAIALPVAAVVLLFLGVTALSRRRLVLAVAVPLAFGVAAAPWPIYNAIDTGYPLTPLDVKVGPLRLGRTTEGVAEWLKTQTLQAYDWKQELDAAKKMYVSPATPREQIGLHSLAFFALFLVAAPFLWRRHGPQAALLLGIFVANLAAFYSPGGAPLRLTWPESASRFLLSAVLVAYPGSAGWCGRRPFLDRVYLAAVLFLTFFFLVRLSLVGTVQSEIDAMLVAAGLAAAVVVLVAALRRTRARAFAAGAGIVAAIAALGVVAVRRDRGRYDPVDAAYFIHSHARNWIEAARAVDEPRVPRLIAHTHGMEPGLSSGFYSFFFGRRLQNRLTFVPTTADGTILRDPNSHPELRDYDAWLRRVDERGVSDVIVLDPSFELTWMEAHGERFQRKTGKKGGSGAFRVLRPRKT